MEESLLILPPRHSCVSSCVRTSPKTVTVLLAWTATARMGVSGCRGGDRSCPCAARDVLRFRRDASASGPRPPVVGYCGPSRHRRPGIDSSRGGFSARQVSRAPLLRFGSPSAHAAASRCPALPTTGRSRSGVSRRPTARPFFNGRCRWLALAVFRLHARGGDLRLANGGPVQVMHRRCSLATRCSATQPDVSATLPEPCFRRHSWGLLPFAVLLLPADLRTFPSVEPTCRFPNRSPR